MSYKMKCWFCLKEIQQDKFKNRGVGICWKCGKPFTPSPYYVKPESHKYCSKDCRYPRFCNDKCEASLKKLLKIWHDQLDYTSYHYNVNRSGIEKRRIRIYKGIILTILSILTVFIFLFIFLK